jgi:hypothetical protein
MDEHYILQLLEGLGLHLTIVGPSPGSHQLARIEWFLSDGVLDSKDVWLA